MNKRIAIAAGAFVLVADMAVAMTSGAAMAQDAALIEAAKKEGKLSYYTTRQIDAMNTFSRAFEAKYGIKVEASRHTNEDLIVKIINENKAGRPSADVFDGSSGITQLIETGLVAPYKPKEADAYAPEFKDKDGNWTAINIYVAGVAYNTDLVKEADVPKKVEDLLDPKWAGRKITYTMQYTVSGLNGFLGGLEKERGADKARDFIAQLHKNGGVAQNATPSAVLDTVASGQYPICLGCNSNGVAILIKKGAPVAFSTKVQPIVSFVSALGVTKTAQSPNAARLFIEFLLSKEGQQLMEEKTDVLSARTDFPSKFAALKPGPNTFMAFAVTPDIVAADLPRWSKVQTEVRQ
jgi:iron(III) transport system substrate-binding protein